jgi:hypothetical protein
VDGSRGLNVLRIIVAALFLVGFAVSLFTKFPTDNSTRLTLNLLAVSAAGFLFGPTFLNWRK